MGLSGIWVGALVVVFGAERSVWRASVLGLALAAGVAAGAAFGLATTFALAATLAAGASAAFVRPRGEAVRGRGVVAVLGALSAFALVMA